MEIKHTPGGPLGKPVIHAVIIALMGLLIYSNTLNTPFHFDDITEIVNNPAIKDLGSFSPFSVAEAPGTGNLPYTLKTRYLGYLSFALNYRAHGLDVWGYHAVNLTLHILNAILVYTLVLLTMRTPRLAGSGITGSSGPSGPSGSVALFSALLFVCHPVQTQAVTYIVQRMSSLVALFYLLSLILYIKARLSIRDGPFRGGITSGGSASAGGTSDSVASDNAANGGSTSGGATSDNAARGGSTSAGSAGAARGGATCGGATCGRSGYVFYAFSLLFAVMAMKTKENALTLPAAIALYEFLFLGYGVTSSGSVTGRCGAWRRIAWRRIALLGPFVLTLLIIPLTMIYAGPSSGPSSGGIAEGLSGAVYAIASGASTDITPWEYFLTETRVLVTYLRMFLLPVGQSLDHDYRVYGSILETGVVLSLVFHAFVLGLGVFLLRQSRRGGDGALAMVSFGLFWFFLTQAVESGVIPIADVMFEHRMYLPSVGVFVAVSAGGALLAVKLRAGRLGAGRPKAYRPKAGRPVLVLAVLVVLVLGAAAHARNGVWGSEVALWEDTVGKSPGKARPHNSLGIAYYQEGSLDKAILHFRISIRLDPDNTIAHTNLAIAVYDNGLVAEAIEHFGAALRLRPDNAIANLNLGLAYNSRGQAGKAIEHFRNVLKIYPGHYEARYSLALAYQNSGQTEQAIKEFEAVLRANPGHREARRSLTRILHEQEISNPSKY